MKVEEKHILRTEYKKKIQNHFLSEDISKIDFKKREQESLKLIKNLERLSLPFAIQIAGYQALPEEPLLESFYKGRSVAFPVLDGDEMNFYNPLNKGSFRENKFSIIEPDPSQSKKVDLKEIQVFLVPGSVFDREGGRIGKGKAYYDHILPKTSALKIGVAWSFQCHSSPLSLESHDIFMDFIVTENFICIPSSKKEGIFPKVLERLSQLKTVSLQDGIL